MKYKLLTLGLVLSVFGLSGCSPTGNIQNNTGQYRQYDYASLSPQRQKMMQIAYQSLGTPYKWAGKNPREGFDCSGLMYYTYQQSGLNIPRTAAQQRDASRTISQSQLVPGDMIFFKTGKRTNHVGIYTGNGEFIHASTSRKQVKKDKLEYQYWQKNFVKYGSFL
jgi:cell wall-associated NlpC family hydrolase